MCILTIREPKTPNRYETEEHERHASHVDSSTPEVGEKEPTDDTADDVASGEGNVYIECLNLREAGCFEEDYGVTEDGIPTEVLSGPNNAVLCIY